MITYFRFDSHNSRASISYAGGVDKTIIAPRISRSLRLSTQATAWFSPTITQQTFRRGLGLLPQRAFRSNQSWLADLPHRGHCSLAPSYNRGLD